MIECAGGCGKKFSSLEIMTGRVMRYRGGPNKDKPICGDCIDRNLEIAKNKTAYDDILERKRLFDTVNSHPEKEHAPDNKP